ncbi:MAG: alanine/ornithine racemase family PLP-dependent enzyme [Saprospirales bacterium]|nr:MAG: alanine/ornithine racemase family PLP-dependent enzyme [Saprospirales bacterium]
MAFLKLYRQKLKANYDFLDKLFKSRDIEWAIVTKLLCGTEIYLKEVLKLGIPEVCDSRVSNLRKVKEINPKVQTVYIKPPAKRSIKEIVEYADVSFNSESSTIRLLSAEAVRQGKKHKVIIMIELGDLREGIMGEHLISFYDAVFELPNIEVVGIGSNLNCLHGVMPSQDKFVILSLYKQLIDAKFSKSIPWITGGTSVVIPMLLNNTLPASINHFRVGETLFFGADLVSGKTIKGMHDDVFRLFSEIIEITEKPVVPIGELAENPSGDVFEVDESDYGRKSYRAIIDIGLLDISPNYLIPDDPELEIVNASSDMLILNLGESAGSYKVGDLISFKLKYMGALGLLNSYYIEKVVSDK